MSLSCTCLEWDGDPDQWWYIPANKFEEFKAKKRKRCCSCKELIDIGSDCLCFDRFRESRSYIEENIWGDEVQLASWYMCEKCGEIYLNLESIGYCLNLGDNMVDCLAEYHELTGFKAA